MSSVTYTPDTRRTATQTFTQDASTTQQHTEKKGWRAYSTLFACAHPGPNMLSFMYACILLYGGSSASSSALKPRNAYGGGKKTEGGRGGQGSSLGGRILTSTHCTEGAKTSLPRTCSQGSRAAKGVILTPMPYDRAEFTRKLTRERRYSTLTDGTGTRIKQ